MAKIKGSNVIPVVRGLRAMKAKAAEKLPPELHRYLQERILVSAWYPEEDAMELMRCFVELTAQPGGDPWEAMGETAAHIHASGSYKHIFETRDVDSIVRHADALWRAYHDTGYIETTILEPGRARLDLRGYGGLTMEWYRLLTGYYRGVLEAGGAGGAEVDALGFRIDGSDLCSWELRWQPQ